MRPPSLAVVDEELAVYRRLLDLAWPIIGLNVLQVLALAVDTAMVGRLSHAEVALTGMGFASQLVFLLMVAMIGLTVGTVASVARAHGALETDRVDHIFHQSVQLTVLLGIAVAIIGNLAAPSLLAMLGANSASAAAGLAYLRPLLLGTVFNYLNILFAALMRGVGNTRLAFLVALVMNGLNLVFNYVLILGNWGFPSLGLAGAAIGTVLSQAIAAGLMWALLSRGAVPGLLATPGWRPLDGTLARELARIGWPAALDMVIFNAAFLTIIGMLARVDQAAVAAHGLGLRVQALAFVPGMSISQATGALVGQALGAGRPDDARRAVRASIVLATAVMSVLALMLVQLDATIVSLFDVDPTSNLGQYAIMWLRLLGYGMPLVGTAITFSGMLQGAGATALSLRINTFVTLGFQIPASAVFGFVLGWGAWGIWAAFPLSFVLRSAIGLWVYRSGTWAKVGARAA